MVSDSASLISRIKRQVRKLTSWKFWRNTLLGLLHVIIYNWIWMLLVGSAGVVYTLRQWLLGGVTLSVALPIWLVVLPWLIALVSLINMLRSRSKSTSGRTERWRMYQRDKFLGLIFCWSYCYSRDPEREGMRFLCNLHSFCRKCQGMAPIRASESGGQLVACCRSCGHAVKLSAEFTRLSDVHRYVVNEIGRRVRKRRRGPDGFEVYDSHT